MRKASATSIMQQLMKNDYVSRREYDDAVAGLENPRRCWRLPGGGAIGKRCSVEPSGSACSARAGAFARERVRGTCPGREPDADVSGEAAELARARRC